MPLEKSELLEIALQVSALKFGEFTLKSGRISPYFFNAGAFNDGNSLHILAKHYANLIARKQEEWQIEALFGPAYKGIPLVAAVAVVLQKDYGLNFPWTFNRKEAKNHGEGGVLVGANLRQKRVLLIDDVLTAGTAIRESLQLLKAEEALPIAVAVILDRQEVLRDGKSALTIFREEENLQTEALFNLQDLLDFSVNNPELEKYQSALLEYRKVYGV